MQGIATKSDDASPWVAMNLIGGRWCHAASGEWGTRLDPATGEVVGRFAASSRTDGEAAIQSARSVFDRSTWSQNPRLRQMVMLRWADRINAQAEELADLLTRENGKVLAQSRGEIAGAISEIRYYAGLARYLPGTVFEVEPGTFSSLLKEPAGVAGIIVPWNAPVVLLIRALTPAMAAGCTAVVKPAAQTSLVTAAVLRALTDDTDIPAGVVNLVCEQEHEVASLLVSSPHVDVLSFTGSNEMGQRIMAAAAPTMKKLSLELGGKAACLVFEDADLGRVAPALAQAATIISGQQCTAARRVLVHASLFEEMKLALSAALSQLKVGPGHEAGVHIGPLIDPASAERINRRIVQAMDEADEVVLKGSRLSSSSAFLSPTLIAHQDASAFFIQEEIFGPLVVLERFESEGEAVQRANHSVFGLSASVWTQNGARAMRVGRALRKGTVWINDHNKLFAEAATGGYRRSGLGRLHGYDALVDFQEIKHIYQHVGTVDMKGAPENS